MHFLTPFLFATYVHAVKLPFEVRVVPIQRRADVTGQSVNVNNGSVPILNTLNSVYISNISLGGETVPVMLDTGSSDLWVTGSIPNAVDTKKATKLEYAVGEAAGDIFTADLIFDNYTVSSQAFLLVANASGFSTNIAAQGYKGLLGLGPNSGSLVRKELDAKGSAGDSVMDRIFELNQTSQNYITFMLDRRGDPGNNVTGQFTISEVVAGYETILQQPKLSVVTVPDLTDEDQHWQIYTDKNGVLGPDGQPIETESIVPKSPDGQLVAVFDSGFTLPQVPRAMSDAIYGRVQGAEWNDANAVWTVPCTQMLNITFMFGGKPFPIHPLDTVSSDFGLTNSSGSPVCAGVFQPITSAFSLLGEYDIILGMGFLRNTYTLIDFGDFVSSSSKDNNDPFVQMLPVTDINKAHSDFVNVRLNGVDSTASPSQALVPASEGLKSPVSKKEKEELLAAKVLSRWPYILLGSLMLFFALVGFCIWRFCCRRRCAARKAAKAKQRHTILQMEPIGAGSYKTLGDVNSPYTSHYATTSDVFSDKYKSNHV